MTPTGHRVFLTGATGLIGGDVLRRLLDEDRTLRATVLVRDPARYSALAARLGPARQRVTLATGDVTAPGLGMDTATRARLAREVTAVLHLAGDTTFSNPLHEARAVNAAGTSRLLDLAADWPRVRRFAHVSTAFVAGTRTGDILERDAATPDGWVNAYEQSKWEGEQLVRAGATDWVILRPSTIVCDGASGIVTQFNVVHRALRLYHHGLAPMMPGAPGSSVDVVTADYVCNGIARLALREDVRGATFHLCAGAGAIPLGELLDVTYHVWARDPAWRRRQVARPALAPLPVYRLFERSVEETGDARLRQVTRSLSHFAPQLALPKRFDTRGADAVLGAPAPPARQYWEQFVTHLLESNWASALRAAA